MTATAQAPAAAGPYPAITLRETAAIIARQQAEKEAAEEYAARCHAQAAALRNIRACQINLAAALYKLAGVRIDINDFQPDQVNVNVDDITFRGDIQSDNMIVTYWLCEHCGADDYLTWYADPSYLPSIVAWHDDHACADCERKREREERWAAEERTEQREYEQRRQRDADEEAAQEAKTWQRQQRRELRQRRRDALNALADALLAKLDAAE